MALVNDIKYVTPFLKFKGYSASPKFALMDTTSAELTYLLPIIGSTLYNHLLAVTTPTAVEKTCLHLARAVAVYRTYLDNIATLQVEFTELGLQTSASDDKEPLHKWEYNEVKEFLLTNALRYEADLLQYLIANAAALQNWENKKLTETFFRTAQDFTEVYPLDKPWLIFPKLRPLIKEAETQYLKSAIGLKTLKELIAIAHPAVAVTPPPVEEEEENEGEGEPAGDGNPEDENEGALPEENDEQETEIPETALPDEDESDTDKVMEAAEFARLYVAYSTIKVACERLTIMITPNGLTVLDGEASADVDYKGQRTAPGNQLSALHSSVANAATKYLKALKDLLNNNASENLFTSYYKSSYYIDPKNPIGSFNQNKKGTFIL